MSSRLRSRLFSLGLGILLLPACSTEQAEGEYYAARSPEGARLQVGEVYPFDLLFMERGERLKTEVFLRLDERLDRAGARLRLRLSYRGEELRTDTLSFAFAPQQGAWERPGIVYHDYIGRLAQPLHAPHTGLYVLEVSLLDSLPLSGVAQLGIHTQRIDAR